MKTVFIALATIVGMVAFEGCNSSSDKPAAPADKQQMSSVSPFAAKFQNGSGCLDVPQVLRAVYSAKNRRATLTDISIAPDGTSVSDEFVSDTIKNADSPEFDPQHDLATRQDGCKSLSLSSGDAMTTFKIVSATPTKIVAKEDTTERASQLSIELISANQMKETVDFPSDMPHDCSQSGQGFGVETHAVSTTGIVDWGDDPLPPAPAVSSALSELKKKASAFDSSPDQAKAEASYCEAINH